MEIICFSADKSPIVLCMYNFVFSGQLTKGTYPSARFVCKWKITNEHPVLTIMFKNPLRTFEANILKIFKDIQPQPKN